MRIVICNRKDKDTAKYITSALHDGRVLHDDKNGDVFFYSNTEDVMGIAKFARIESGTYSFNALGELVKD